MRCPTRFSVDLESGHVDTVAHLRYGSARAGVGVSPMDSSGAIWLKFRDLFGEWLVPGRDDWALTSNGTIALVRGSDYHIEWIRSDGAVSSTGKLPFDWSNRNDQLRKEADSARALDSLLPSIRLRAASGSGARGAAGADTFLLWAQGSYVQARLNLRRLDRAFLGGGSGSVLPDLDGNLWILPGESLPSASTQLVYDVVNSRGELVQRVRVPAGRAIAGFGKAGVVYLVSGDRVNGYQVEKTRIGKH